MAPALESANLGLSQALNAQTAGLNEYGAKIGIALKPFDIEAGLLGPEVQASYDLFKSNLSDEVNMAIAKLQSDTALTQEEIRKSVELAKLADQVNSGSISVNDAGDRLLVLDQEGNLRYTYPKGKLATLGASGW
jgi:lipoprotein-anchoring transpeptidase ErfK/SrfK